MSRDLTASMLTGVQASEVDPILFYEGEFGSGYVRLFTGVGTITWDSKTWTGGGGLIGLSNFEEAADLVAAKLQVFLTGCDPSTVSLALTEARQGMVGKIWLGLLERQAAALPYDNGDTLDGGTAALAGSDTLDAGTAATAYTETIDGGTAGALPSGSITTLSVAADPVLVFVGLLDQPDIAFGDDSAEVAITYENVLADMNVPREFRYTPESQRVLYSGTTDKGFDFVTKIQDKPIEWGLK